MRDVSRQVLIYSTVLNIKAGDHASALNLSCLGLRNGGEEERRGWWLLLRGPCLEKSGRGEKWDPKKNRNGWSVWEKADKWDLENRNGGGGK